MHKKIHKPISASDYFDLAQVLNHVGNCPCENCEKSLAELERDMPEEVLLARKLETIPIQKQFQALMEDLNVDQLKSLVEVEVEA